MGIKDSKDMDAFVIRQVCAAPIVDRALKERAERGYTVISEHLLREGYGPELGAVIVRFACPRCVIELPFPALRATFYQDTLEVMALADPYVIGKRLPLPQTLPSLRLEGSLPFVLAVPSPRNFPVHENQIAFFNLRERRWARERGIVLAGFLGE
jgi:hypothetical protein